MKRQKNKIINYWFSIFALMISQASVDAVWCASSYANEATMMLSTDGLKPEEIVSLLQAKLKADTSQLGYYQELLQQYLLLNKPNEANAIFGRAGKQFPNHYDILIMQADLLLGLPVTRDKTELGKALPKLSQLISKAEAADPNHAGTYYLKGMRAYLQGELELAENHLLRSHALDANFIRTHHALLDVYLDRDMIPETSNLLAHTLELQPNDVDTLFLMGRFFSQKGDPARGLNALEKSQALDPKPRYRRLMLIAQAQQQTGKTEKAAESYKKLVTLWPKRTENWIKYAQILDSLNREKEAMLAYQKAYQANPGMLQTFIQQATNAFWSRKLNEALPLYRKAFLIAPDREDLLTLMVSIRFRQWMEGARPMSSSLDELEGWIRKRQEKGLSPVLELSDMQLQVIRTGEWSPGLLMALEQFAKQQSNAYLKAEAYILLHQPVNAQNMTSQFDAPKSLEQQLQRFMLIGAWPWAKQLSLNEDVGAFQNEMLQWAQSDQSRAQSLVSQAKTFNAVKMGDKALKVLDQAQHFDPLSAAIQIEMAQAYFNQQVWSQAQKHLKLASELDPSTEIATRLAQMESDISKSQSKQKKSGLSKK